MKLAALEHAWSLSDEHRRDVAVRMIAYSLRMSGRTLESLGDVPASEERDEQHHEDADEHDVTEREIHG